MTQSETVKFRLALNSLHLEYEGSEAFLRSEIPGMLQRVDKLLVTRLGPELAALQQASSDSLGTVGMLEDEMDTLKRELDSLNELGETESLRLQMAMDRLSKLMSTLSNILKKISDTSDTMVQNLK